MSVSFLLWLVIGALLIAAEIMTGTFYLLIFGVAAWVGASVNYAGYTVDYQLGAAGLAAVVGLAIVRYLKRRRPGERPADHDLDVGNEVRVESVNGKRLKVQYRGAVWDAVLAAGASGLCAGDTGVISAVQGNTLVVQSSRH
jgi:membrane protein implicated in regulation of membrane protease activity